MTTPAEAIKAAIIDVTKAWARQRKQEERDRNAISNRRDRLVRTRRSTIRDAAFEVMEEAYLVASDNGKLPTKPRQIMYVARPTILRVTGKDTLGSSYFSQDLLIDYMEEYNCDGWDIIWDARGHFAEPHTGTEIALGTLEVRQYLGMRPSFEPPKRDDASDLVFPTAGPQNRYRNVLFIEKEGFHQILRAARLQERFDVAIMSTKGMSVTASRLLVDKLTPNVDHLFVLHDFDVSGFSISGTLGTNSRRYVFGNSCPIIDIGLRLADVEGLQSEPVPFKPDEWPKRSRTLRRHGATEAEIDFLRKRRVELNAMTSRQIVDFIEAALIKHGVTKLIPDDDVVEHHARRIIEARLTEKALAKLYAEISKQASMAALPENLRKMISAKFEEHPTLPWDLALSEILREKIGIGGHLAVPPLPHHRAYGSRTTAVRLG